MITAAVSAISLDPGPASRAGVCAFSSFDELGCLPNELEEVAGHPGWHILGNGLPALVAHRVTELDLEQNLWDMEDWTWVAVFVPLEPANRLPKKGDVWTQVLTMPTLNYEEVVKTIAERDGELDGARDTVTLFHVDQLPKDILSNRSPAKPTTTKHHLSRKAGTQMMMMVRALGWRLPTTRQWQWMGVSLKTRRPMAKKSSRALPLAWRRP